MRAHYNRRRDAPPQIVASPGFFLFDRGLCTSLPSANSRADRYRSYTPPNRGPTVCDTGSHGCRRIGRRRKLR